MANGYSAARGGEVEAKGPVVGPSTLAAAGVIVAALYFGREVLVPFVVAVLLSFVLAGPVRGLQKLGLGKSFPVAIVVLCAFLFIFAVMAILTNQTAELVGELPRYQTTIREKVTALRDTVAGSGPLERLVDMFQSLSSELSMKAPTDPLAPESATPQKPLPVEITNQSGGPLGTIAALLSPVVHPLAMMGLTIVFTVFMLIQRGDLRNRAIRLAGSHDLQRTTEAMNDAASRLSRFFLVQVLLNSGFGLFVGIGLWLIGVPSPVLWGILAAISRFIPYVGVVLAAGGPLILAAAVDPYWTMLGMTALFFALSEFLLGQVIEPLVYGHSTGLSPIAVIGSVTFWTWLWGPIGLLLATPLTVCLVVLGRHVDRLAFLEVMLGDRPPLTLAESFYQRVLAGDSGELVEQAYGFLKEHTLATYYDEVAVKGLALAQSDREREALDEKRLARVVDTMAVLIEDLAEHEDVGGAGESAKAEAKHAETKRAAGDEGLDEWLDEADRRALDLPVLARVEGAAPTPSVICLGGRNELDGIGAALLAQILARHGVEAVVEGPETPGDDVVKLPDPRARIVCLSYLDTSSPAHVRYTVRRLRRRLPEAKVIVGAWGLDEGATKGFCESTRTDYCTSRLTETAGICLDLLRGPQEPVEAAAVAAEAPLAANG
jgi:predicted PurR-regulated permease PerM